MHWMNLAELNIFVLSSVLIIFLMIYITAWATSAQTDKNKDRIKALENEVDKLRTELNKHINH